MYLYLIIAIVGILLYLRNMMTTMQIFKSYYNGKRKKFPWLDNWLKGGRIDVAKLRGKTAINRLTDFAVIYMAIAFVGGLVLNYIIAFATEMILFNNNLTPSEFEYMIYTNVGKVIAAAAAVIVSQKIWINRLADPSSKYTAWEGLTLECPACECPHSWVMIKQRNVLEGKSTTTVTTTTTRSASADSYGGGFIGGLFAGAASGSSSSTSTEITYYGKAHRSFKCENCGEVQNNTYNETWSFPPDENETMFDPPKQSWHPSHEAGRIVGLIRVAALLVMVWIAFTYAGKIVTEPYTTGRQATQIHAGDIDPSLNGIITNRYSSVAIRAEPKKGSEEIGRIPTGVFFKLMGKSGKYTQVEYNGIQGYAYSEAVKKRSKNRVAEVVYAVQIGDSPDTNAKTRTVPKGTKVALLGENVNGFVKIEYVGEVYWIHAPNLKNW